MVHQDHRSFSKQQLFSPQYVLVPGIIPPRVQGLVALSCIAFQGVLVCQFLQPVEVHLSDSTIVRYNSHSSVVLSVVQDINEDVKQYWA